MINRNRELGNILGIDPGFRHIGYSICGLTETGELIPKKMGVIVSNPPKNSTETKSKQNLDRIRFIHDELNRIIEKNNIRVICVESMSFPRNASAAAKMAMCWGTIGSLAEIHNLEVHQASPQKIKRHITKLNKASKKEVEDALNAKFKRIEGIVSILPDIASGITPSLQNHAYDSLAATVTLVESLHPLDLVYGHARCLRK